MHLRALLLLSFLILSSDRPRAQANQLYAIHNQGTSGSLYTVNTNTAALTQVGPIGFICDAIAFAPDGRLFAADNTNFQLVVLNPSNGAVVTIIGPFNDFNSHVERMAFHPHTGVLYGLDSFNFKLVTIDTTTGQITTVGPTGAPPTPAGLTWSLDGSTLYMCDLFDGCLYEVDPSTGFSTQVGCDDAQEPFGLATDAFSGQAYAVETQSLGANDAHLARINLNTGARTTIGTMVGGPKIEDITFGPGAGSGYCVATVNSTGKSARIFSSGSPSSSAANLTMAATEVPNQPGIFFHGANMIQVSFGNGFLCVGGGLRRGRPTFPANRLALYTYDNSDAKHSLAAHIGSTRNFQFWFRDPMGGGAAFNLTDAVSVSITP